MLEKIKFFEGFIRCRRNYILNIRNIVEKRGRRQREKEMESNREKRGDKKQE